ncbi:hypothetical protein [Novosphingobium sp. RL4]|nr:hypothetical protein [Novosphingobium sp. RL4]WRT93595.1 hypothetical protein U9J33_03535 [Novosphingobium sp. RL4]
MAVDPASGDPPEETDLKPERRPLLGLAIAIAFSATFWIMLAVWLL